MPSTLSEGRARRPFLPVVVFLAGVSWLAMVGAYVVVRAVVGWIV